MAPSLKKTTQNTNKIPILAVVLAGAFVAILNQTLLNTAIPKIMGDLHISANTAQWLTTVFMLTNGVMIPVTAFLIEKFTARALFMTAISLFAIGTLIAGFSVNFPMMLIGRIVQASGAGIMLPLMQTIILIIFPREKRGTAMGMVGLIIAFAPAIGPTLSGWIVLNHSWRVLFYLIFPIAILDLIFAYFVMRNVTRQTYPKVDLLSIILSSLGFGGLLYGFSSAGGSGWGSEKVIFSLVIGAIALCLFIWRQLIAKTPMLNFKIFKSFTFTLTSIIGMIVFVTMISGELLLPMYMQNMRGFSSLDSGLTLLPGALIMGLTSPFAGRLFDKIGARPLGATGLIILTIATYLFTHITVTTSETYLVIVYAIRMLGMALVMMPITTAGLNQLPQRLIPHGTAMNNTMRQVAASIGTALLVTVMTTTTKHSLASLGAKKAMIHGINVAFQVSTALALLGFILTLFVKQKGQADEEANDGTRREPAREATDS